MNRVTRSSDLRSPSVSVVLPVLNEAARLSDALASVGPVARGVEVLVVDGGSRDESCARALEAGARLLTSQLHQRSAQMNLGGRKAAGAILLFLHADTRLPAGWEEAMNGALAGHPRMVGGAFRRCFDTDSRFLQWICRLADWRGRRLGWFLGDQAIFVRRDVFRRLGGFAPLPVFEDLDFSMRMNRAGRTRLLEAKVTSSGRRFDRRGPFRQTCRDFLLTMGFLARRIADPSDAESFADERSRPLARNGRPVHL